MPESGGAAVCGPSGWLVALSHPHCAGSRRCLLLKVLPSSCHRNDAGNSKGDCCFCRTETIVVWCARDSITGARRLRQLHAQLDTGDWLDLSQCRIRPGKLGSAEAGGIEYGCWRCGLDQVNSVQHTRPSQSSATDSAGCIIAQRCSRAVGGGEGCVCASPSYRRRLCVRVDGASCLPHGWLDVTVVRGIEHRREQTDEDGSADYGPATLVLFPSTLPSLSAGRALLGRTLRVSNVHLYSRPDAWPSAVLVAFAYTNLRWHSETDDLDAEPSVVDDADYRSDACPARRLWTSGRGRRQEFADLGDVFRLLGWSASLRHGLPDRRLPSIRRLLAALANALEPSTRPASRHPPTDSVEFLLARRPSPDHRPEVAGSIPGLLVLGARDLAIDTPVVGRRVAYDTVGERLRLDAFSGAGVGIRLVLGDDLDAFRLKLSTRLTTLAAVKPRKRVTRLVRDWDGTRCLLTWLGDLVTVGEDEASASAAAPVSLELDVTSCHSASPGRFSVAGRLLNPCGRRVLMELGGSAAVLRELLLPSSSYRIVPCDTEAGAVRAALAADAAASVDAWPALIGLERRPISVECLRLRRSDWLTPSRLRDAASTPDGGRRLFPVRGRLVDMSPAGCPGNAWLLLSDQLVPECTVRVEFSAPIGQLRRLQFLRRLADEFRLWPDDLLVLNASRLFTPGGGARLECACADANPTLHLVSVSVTQAGLAAPAKIGALIELNLARPGEPMAAWFDEGREFVLDCFLSAVCRVQMRRPHSSAPPSDAQPPPPAADADAFALVQDGTQFASLACRGFPAVCRLLALPSAFADRLLQQLHQQGGSDSGPREVLNYRRAWEDPGGGGRADSTSFLGECLRCHLESARCRRPLRLLVRLRQRPKLIDELAPADLLPRRRLPDVALTLLRVL